MKFEHLVMHKLGQIALDNFSLKVIEELKSNPITNGSEFSSQEADIETFWDELCLQSQGTRNFAWEEFLGELETIAYHMLKKLSLEEQFAMWMVVEDLDDLLRDLEEKSVESFEEIDHFKIDNIATAEFVRQKVFKAACVEKHPVVSRILG